MPALLLVVLLAAASISPLAALNIRRRTTASELEWRLLKLDLEACPQSTSPPNQPCVAFPSGLLHAEMLAQLRLPAAGELATAAQALALQDAVNAAFAAYGVGGRAGADEALVDSLFSAATEHLVPPRPVALPSLAWPTAFRNDVALALLLTGRSRPLADLVLSQIEADECPAVEAQVKLNYQYNPLSCLVPIVPPRGLEPRPVARAHGKRTGVRACLARAAAAARLRPRRGHLEGAARRRQAARAQLPGARHPGARRPLQGAHAPQEGAHDVMRAT